MCAIYEDDLPTEDSLLDGDYSPETTEDWENLKLKIKN